ncbi:unnamed protein product [Schistosoma mattheei]|uniref:Uncharacterized protein n=1 Tax=Schistosoma mattheei TaxID=31246 RepID=A0A183P810_9TREM|nr:unnamed protein product [Schistosoma mattheei]
MSNLKLSPNYSSSLFSLPINSQCSSSLCINKPQHNQGENQDPQIQHGGEDWQSKDSIPTVEEHMELKTTVYQPISNSQSSIRMSKQFYYTELKRGEQLKPSSKR